MYLRAADRQELTLGFGEELWKLSGGSRRHDDVRLPGGVRW